MYSYEYALVVYNNKRFSTHVLSVSLSSLNSLSQFLSSIYFHTHHSDVCRGGIVVCFVALGKGKAFCGTDSCKSWKIWLEICRGMFVAVGIELQVSSTTIQCYILYR